jgi:tripartite-type tricarboxylate transporter receptor subunit TctC
MGYSGLGTPNHLAMLDLESLTQTKFNGIAYRGSGPMLQDMMAGQIEIAPDQVSTSKPYIDSGDLIPLAVFGAPLAMLPGVPSVSTLGPEPFDATTYLGVTAPAGTPDDVIAILQKASKKAIEDPRFAGGMVKFSSAVYWGSSQDFETKMKAEDKFIQQMVAAGSIKPE